MASSDADLAALHVAAADFTALFHGLRSHPNFRRLLLYPDGSAHVIVSTDASNWGSLRQLVGANALPDPSFPVKQLGLSSGSASNGAASPSNLVAVRYQPFRLPHADVERFFSLFPGVLNVEVRTRTAQPGPASQMPFGEALIQLSNEDYGRQLLETINRTTNWEAVYVRLPPGALGTSTQAPAPLSDANYSSTGAAGIYKTPGAVAVASDAVALTQSSSVISDSRAAVNGVPGSAGGSRPFQSLPGVATARNEQTEVQVTITHPPGTPKEIAGNWVVKCVAGLENIIWVAPSADPDSASTGALLRFHAAPLLQAFLSQQPVCEGPFGVAVANTPVPIIAVPASTPAPNFQMLPTNGSREAWSSGSNVPRERDRFRRDRSAGSGSEDREFSRDRAQPQRAQPQNPYNAPRTTLQLTSIPPHLDRADLRRFSRSLAGFKKIAFYRDWCFLVFGTPEAAHAAMRIVNDGTVGFLGGMRASFTKENYLQKHPPPPSGPPNPTLYVTNLPFNANPNEFRRLFSDFDGFQDAYFFRGSCKVYFRDTESADRTRKELNEETNLVATFWSGGGGTSSGSGAGSNSGSFAANVSNTGSKGGSEAGSSRGPGSEKSSDRGSENAPSESGEDAGDEDEEDYSAKMASSVGSLSSSHAASNRPPRATIHITNLSVANTGSGTGTTNHDKADLLQLLSSFTGFVRVAFYRDWVFAVFSSPQLAAEAIDRLHRETKMRASYAREEYAPNYIVPDSGAPCAVLYVCNLPWDATNLELTKIFKMYEGFREVYFFREACKVYFDDLSRAKRCLEDLNSRTNLIATFFKGEAGLGMGEDEHWEDDTKAMLAANLGALGIGTAGYGTGRAEPKSTLHVSNLTKDRAELKQLFGTFDGFSRIAFYPNWVFVVFNDVAAAGKAIEQIHATTRMQAAFAQVEYAAPFVRPEIGEPSKAVRVGNFPSNAVEGEFMKLFRGYQGATGEVRFGREDCLVWFQNVEAASNFLDDINSKTNLCAVFYPTSYNASGTSNGRIGTSSTSQPLPAGFGNATGGGSGFGGREERLEFWEDDDLAHAPSPGNSEHDYMSSASSRSDALGVPQAVQSNSSHAPKVTLKIGNITMDRADIKRTLSTLEGFQRIAFYRDYIYACFATMEHAKRAMDWINLNTRMRCVFPKYDYTSRSDKADPGVPCPILHVSNLPFNATPGEFVKILSVYDGYRDVQFFRESCLVFFSSSEDAARAARDLTETTNLVAVFSKKGLSALHASQQQAQVQASLAASSLFQDRLRAGSPPMDMKSLASVGLGYLFANDARFEGVTASTLGLNTSVDQRPAFEDVLQRRNSSPAAPGVIGGQQRIPLPFAFSGSPREGFLSGGTSLFSSSSGERKFDDGQEDDWLEQQQRRRSLALADEIIGFDDNTEDARYGFSQYVEPWDVSGSNSPDVLGMGRTGATPASRPSLLRNDRAQETANYLFNSAVPVAGTSSLLSGFSNVGQDSSAKADFAGLLGGGLDAAQSSLTNVLQSLPQPVKQYITVLKSHIANLESKLNEMSSELDLLKRSSIGRPTW